MSRYDTPEKRAIHAEEQRRYRVGRPAQVRVTKRKYKEAHPNAKAEETKRHFEKYPEKLRARKAISSRVHRGRLKKPDACSKCGAVGYVEAHHYLGYAWEHRLDVLWVCKPCHRELEGVSG